MEVSNIIQAIVDNGVAIGLVIVFIIGVFRPPTWLVKQVDRFTNAYEESQKSIAGSVAKMEEAFLETHASIEVMRQALNGMAKLEEDRDRTLTDLISRVSVTQSSIATIAAAMDRRRQSWTEEQRDAKRQLDSTREKDANV